MARKVFHSLEEARESLAPGAVAIGNFDGVHRGHAALLRKCRNSAPTSIALTFEPHPAEFFGRQVDRLTSPERKLELILNSGVDGVVVLKFDEKLASMTPEEFIDMLVTRLGPSHVWVGAGFRFGRGRSGDARRLKELLTARGVRAHVLRSVSRNGEPVSSTRIRTLLSHGEVEDAALLLGRAYQLEGTVVPGAGKGRELGYPTINVHTDMLVPGDGVYAGFVHLPEGCWPAAISIGSKPTLDDGEARVLEAHLIGFDGDLYGRRVGVSFLYRLRNQEKFADAAELAEKIHEDVERVRALLIEEELHEETNH